MTAEGGVPIACSLDTASFQERAEEWRALVRSSSVTSVEAGDSAVRLVLGDSDDALTTAVALAQREKHCCPFFDVSVALDAERRTLILAVPDGAQDVLGVVRRAARPSILTRSRHTMKGAAPSASMPKPAMASETTEGSIPPPRASCCSTATTRLAVSTSK